MGLSFRVITGRMPFLNLVAVRMNLSFRTAMLITQLRVKRRICRYLIKDRRKYSTGGLHGHSRFLVLARPKGGLCRSPGDPRRGTGAARMRLAGVSRGPSVSPSRVLSIKS